MKPATFEYIRADSLEMLCHHLAAGNEDEDRRILAGGQTLVPLMAMRLARPSHLIDINPIVALRGIHARQDHVEIGAMTRQRSLEKDRTVATHLPLLAKAMPFVGHVQTRNRGTIGGSIANGDASAEIALVALILDAELSIIGPRGERSAGIEKFFLGPMTTALAEDECLTAIHLPIWRGEAGQGCSFLEIAPRHGDYALVSAAVQLALDDSGRIARIAIGLGGCGGTPVRLRAVEERLLGRAPENDIFARASADIATLITPENTNLASADYRRRVAPGLLHRALCAAGEEARGLSKR